MVPLGKEYVLLHYPNFSFPCLFFTVPDLSFGEGAQKLSGALQVGNCRDKQGLGNKLKDLSHTPLTEPAFFKLPEIPFLFLGFRAIPNSVQRTPPDSALAITPGCARGTVMCCQGQTHERQAP